MDTPMMTTARKSFLLSLTFHALMGSLAFGVLTQLTTPPKLVKIPMHHVTLISLSKPSPSPKPQPLQPPLSEKIKPLVKEPQKPLLQKQSVAKEPIAIAPPQSPALSHVTPTAAPTQALVAPTPPPVKVSPKPDLTAAKRSFFASLRTTIQNHLRYPSAARRRGMEGEIDVRFTLANDGTINTISIQRGEAIFHNAVKTAVSSASGIDVPKNLADSLPMEIELTLEFKLNS
jgi:protein TonB